MMTCSENAMQSGINEDVRVTSRVTTFFLFIFWKKIIIFRAALEFCKTTASQFVLIRKQEKDSQMTILNPCH